MRHDLEFDAEGATLRGWFYEAEGATGTAPCVVMAHGWTSTKRMYLDKFAEVFAAAGLAVLVFDNRGWGDSGTAPGKPRYEIDFLPGGHFAAYTGDGFTAASHAARDWFLSHL